MIKVNCKCGYELIKPRWQHIIHNVYKQGGHAGKSICPKCKSDTLEFDFGEGD